MSADRLEIRATLLPLGIVLFGALFVPDIRLGQESALVTHMLVQLPLLVLCGWCAGTGLAASSPALRQTEWNRGGVPGLIIAITTLLFWMLPKSLDGALDNPVLEFAKFVTLPACLGFLLAVSWPRAHVLVRGLLMAQFISMLGVLGFLYVNAPVRICNNYLVSEQQTAGLLLGGAALVLSLWWGGQLFFVRARPGNRPAPTTREAFAHG